MIEDPYSDKRSELARLLVTREVGGVDQLVGGLADEELDPSIAAVAWWDKQPSAKKTTGLLVWALRNVAEIPSGAAVGASGITPTLERAIKGSCLSPNGFTRDMARDMIKGQAKRLGMTQDALIDAVMGEEWLVTLPDARHDPEAPREERIADQLRYDREQAAR